MAGLYRRNIQAEIKGLPDHEWAGDYYQGDGLGENISLLLAPKSGYLYEWRGCLGLYDRNYGAVTAEKGKLHLTFTLPNEPEGLKGIAQDFTPVAWGERKYLVPSAEIVGFCNKVNEGSEPRPELRGFSLLRRGDEKKEAKGFPLVPEQYKPYLLSRPIETEIVEVRQSTTRPKFADLTFKDTPVVLNRGTKQGLLKGMELHVVEPTDMVQLVTIAKTEDDRSEGVMTQIGEKMAGPQVGWKLSTRAPWYP